MERDGKEFWMQWVQYKHDLVKIKELEAKNQKLTDALEKIADGDEHPMAMVDIAREVLAEMHLKDTK